jgi:hypothetical protein
MQPSSDIDSGGKDKARTSGPKNRFHGLAHARRALRSLRRSAVISTHFVPANPISNRTEAKDRKQSCEPPPPFHLPWRSGQIVIPGGCPKMPGWQRRRHNRLHSQFGHILCALPVRKLVGPYEDVSRIREGRECLFQLLKGKRTDLPYPIGVVPDVRDQPLPDLPVG